MFVLGSLAIIFVASRGALAVGSPFGFASGTTGGASAAQAIPTSAAELKSWLADSTPRNILLDRTYDFTDTEGSVTEIGCKPWTCSSNPQLAINANNWCSSSAAKVSVTYKKAGTSGLVVGSNKTILGKGTSGWIKGKGLRLAGSKNVIIQNIRISDINAQYVWGGDAISLQGATNVWIDHNYFKNVGRQFIVSHFDPNTKVTISNNYFNGQSTYSTGCDQHHYWAFLLLGKDDQITFARNYVYFTSGRGPHIGGTSGNKQTLHMFNNYFNDITGHALDAGVGAQVLAEGNYFDKVKTPSTGNMDGAVFAATSSSMADQCSSRIGRKCVLNTLAGGSGTLDNAANNGIVAQFTASVVKSASIMDPSAVAAHVLGNAGTGKVN
ncbi:pectin lyase F, putative [Rhizoctonia solani AG-3 Rhs1AP]|uniref:pectin lyase n=1 Tax=Rhizoctonia solani AG-3 Rhs1AP TaxID=1086054 RepID=X8IZF4_9AGAM|nr:pectin lyase F, putative [Rhizoctonia solani AG-3 Rhs1AP]